jgi:tetratricopeptide (TPR) repeat protein
LYPHGTLIIEQLFIFLFSINQLKLLTLLMSQNWSPTSVNSTSNITFTTNNGEEDDTSIVSPIRDRNYKTKNDTDKGFLLKRKDFIGVDEEAESHPNRTYYYKKSFDADKVIETCTRKLMYEPNNLNALYLRGSAYFKKGMYDFSLADFTLMVITQLIQIKLTICSL